VPTVRHFGEQSRRSDDRKRGIQNPAKRRASLLTCLAWGIALHLVFGWLALVNGVSHDKQRRARREQEGEQAEAEGRAEAAERRREEAHRARMVAHVARMEAHRARMEAHKAKHGKGER